MKTHHRKDERGQALVETALFAMLAVIMAFGLLTWIPTHRARTAATTAAYACSQFLSQSPDPVRARRNAVNVAWQTLNADWSATAGVQYRVQVSPPGGPGEPGHLITVISLVCPRIILMTNDYWNSCTKPGVNQSSFRMRREEKAGMAGTAQATGVNTSYQEGRNHCPAQTTPSLTTG